jgi:hypothetical protein
MLMNKPATSLFVFGIYCLFSGLTFVVIPNVFLGLLNVAITTEQWIRVMGVLLAYLGIYYILAARAELKKFIQWSVYIRASVIFVFLIFVLLGIGQPTLLIFGFIDLLGAIWTAIELRRSSQG